MIWPSINRYLRQSSGVRIYKSAIRPVLSYFVETWTETEQQSEASDTKLLRKAELVIWKTYKM